MRTPWHREPPKAAAEVETDDDEFLTVDKWPRDVFGAHYHEEFNWIVLSRPGRMVVEVEGREHALDSNRWICIFPRTAHAVVHVSDDCEVLSLFIPEETMLRGFEALQLSARSIEARCIVGTAGVVAQGLALAWGERRFARRPRDPVDAALEEFVTRWIWRAYKSAVDLAPTWAQRVRLRLGPMGEVMATFCDEHLADTPFPWDALARRLGVSRRTLQRRSFGALGVGPSDVLTGMRLDRARELIPDASLTIGHIALACGFASQSHFSTAFKTEHGISPAAFRVSLSRKTLSPML